MKKIIIGIQGDKGSTNERACRFFSEKHGWADYEIKFLISTENVLRELNEGKIDYGTFAWESSRGGLVDETREAVKKYDYEKIDEFDFQLDHALLAKPDNEIDKEDEVKIYSHPQAFKEHAAFLKKKFSKVNLIEEVDTGRAAANLSEGKYPKNSLSLAGVACAELFGLDIYLADLPSNVGYLTKIILVKKK